MSNVTKYVKVFYIIVFVTIVEHLFAQNLSEKEKELNTVLLYLRSSTSDEDVNIRNKEFKKKMVSFLSEEGAFNYKFEHCKTIAVIDSPDELVRLITWNLEYSDFTYAYDGLVLYYDESRDRYVIHELNDALDPYQEKPTDVINASSWYGALYYKILPFERRGKTEYLLLGWDGGTPSSNFKLIDVMVVNRNSVKFGSPVFKENKTTSKRVIFEYSEQAKMSLRFDDKRNRIVFDHLSPESPSLDGLKSYYVPDMSYDAFVEEDGMWYLISDIIAVNDGDPKKSKKYWIDPSDDSENGIKHVARTPESELMEYENQKDLMPKKIKKRRKKNPNNLEITTGKYRYKKNRKKYKKFDFE
jgi:hypothetical protein